jgi:tRNA pseudouridine38-40 synthase
VWHVDDLEGNFNITQAQLCCQLFVGTHDFGAFRARDKDDSKDGDTIRTISMFQMNHSPCPSVSVVDGLLSPITTGATEGNVHRQKRTITYQVLVTGNRFMYKMVRILVGAVIAVGMGKETLESVHTALGSKTDENRYKFCAPAHGLALLNVSYPDNFIFSWSRR